MNNRIIYHAKKNNCKVPVFTIAMEYKANASKENGAISPTLYIAWAKPYSGENYDKVIGRLIVESRLDKIINDGKSYNKLPHIVKKNLNFYINKAKSYFKEMPNDVIYLM